MSTRLEAGWLAVVVAAGAGVGFARANAGSTLNSEHAVRARSAEPKRAIFMESPVSFLSKCELCCHGSAHTFWRSAPDATASRLNRGCRADPQPRPASRPIRQQLEPANPQA